ncbi:MAG: RNA polymerase sigma factor [Planctomycetota bacterium]
MQRAREPQLVEEARRGDRRALETLWREYRRWVAAILLAHRPAGADLDDLLQDVAVALVERIGDLRSAASFRGWLRTVALNVARTHGRRAALEHRRRKELSADVLAADGAAAAESHAALASNDGVAAHEERARVLRAFDTLTPDERELLVLRSVRGLSQRELAQMMVLPETTIETRLARARKKLRASLAKSNHWQGEHGNLS